MSGGAASTSAGRALWPLPPPPSEERRQAALAGGAAADAPVSGGAEAEEEDATESEISEEMVQQRAPAVTFANPDRDPRLLRALQSGKWDAGSMSARFRLPQGVQRSLDVVGGVVERRGARVDGHRGLLVFFVAVGLFVAMLLQQRNSYEMSTVVDPVRSVLSPGESGTVMKGKDSVYAWMEGNVWPLWTDPVCGDGVCESPFEVPGYGRFGCFLDCGLEERTTTMLLRVSASFFAPPGFEAPPRSAAELMTEATWNLCLKQSEEVCWYEQDRTFNRPDRSTATLPVNLPDGQYYLRVRGDTFGRVSAKVIDISNSTDPQVVSSLASCPLPKTPLAVVVDRKTGLLAGGEASRRLRAFNSRIDRVLRDGRALAEARGGAAAAVEDRPASGAPADSSGRMRTRRALLSSQDDWEPEVDCSHPDAVCDFFEYSEYMLKYHMLHNTTCAHFLLEGGRDYDYPLADLAEEFAGTLPLLDRQLSFTGRLEALRDEDSGFPDLVREVMGATGDWSTEDAEYAGVFSAAYSASELANLSPSAVGGLSVSALELMSPEQLAAFSPEGLRTLRGISEVALTGHKLGAMSTEQIKAAVLPDTVVGGDTVSLDTPEYVVDGAVRIVFPTHDAPDGDLFEAVYDALDLVASAAARINNQDYSDYYDNQEYSEYYDNQEYSEYHNQEYSQHYNRQYYYDDAMNAQEHSDYYNQEHSDYYHNQEYSDYHNHEYDYAINNRDYDYSGHNHRYEDYTISLTLQPQEYYERDERLCVTPERPANATDALECESQPYYSFEGAAEQEFTSGETCALGEVVDTTNSCYDEYPCYSEVDESCKEAVASCVPVQSDPNKKVGAAYSTCGERQGSLAVASFKCDPCCPTRQTFFRDAEVWHSLGETTATGTDNQTRVAIFRVGLFDRAAAIKFHKALRAAGEILKGRAGDGTTTYLVELDYEEADESARTRFDFPDTGGDDDDRRRKRHLSSSARELTPLELLLEAGLSQTDFTDFNDMTDVLLVDHIYSFNGHFVGGPPKFADGYSLECPFECDSGIRGIAYECPCTRQECAAPGRGASYAFDPTTATPRCLLVMREYCGSQGGGDACDAVRAHRSGAQEFEGDRGGTMEIAGTGHQMRVPAGAFSGSMSLGMVALSSNDVPTLSQKLSSGAFGKGARSDYVSLTPHGMAFDQPVTLQVPYEPYGEGGVYILKADSINSTEWAEVLEPHTISYVNASYAYAYVNVTSFSSAGYMEMFAAPFVEEVLVAATDALGHKQEHFEVEISPSESELLTGTRVTLTYYFPGGDSSLAVETLLREPQVVFASSSVLTNALIPSAQSVVYSSVSTITFEVDSFVEIDHSYVGTGCGLGKTACDDGTCIDLFDICDGNINCPTAEDEAAGCTSLDFVVVVPEPPMPPVPPPPAPLPTAASLDINYDYEEDDSELELQCDDGQFRCADLSGCVSNSAVCDRVDYDCPDNSDELKCDYDPPVITVLGDREIFIVGNTTAGYTDAGATALDAIDGVVSVRVLGFGDVDVTRVGEYVITYIATDESCDGTPDNSGVCSTEETRVITVTSPCEDGEYVCADSSTPEDPQCSRFGVCGAAFVEVQAESAPAEVFVAIQDTDPPVLSLTQDEYSTGAERNVAGLLVMSTNWTQGVPYVDAGATAYDAEDGDVTALVSSVGILEVDVSQLTIDLPYVVTYSVSDSAGNAAMVARRRIYVVCRDENGNQVERCKGDDFDDNMCPGAGGVCGVQAISFDEEEEVEILPPYITPEPPPDGLPPVEIEEGSPYVMCTPDTPKTQICEPGINVTDPQEGSLASVLRACGSNFVRNGVTNCEVSRSPEPRTEPYVIDFEACNSAGMCVSTYRNVKVVPKGGCPEGTRQCADGITCSDFELICESELTASAPQEEEEVVVDQPPTITLRTSSDGVLGEYAKLYKSVKQLEAGYSVCDGAVPSEEVLCELGVDASDEENGDLTNTILSCPPDSCINEGIGCSGHEYYTKTGDINKGVTGCVNPDAPFGTEFAVTFVVYDLAQPPQQATVTRTITISNPCTELNEEYCDDGECSTGFSTCAERDAVREQAAALGGDDDVEAGDTVPPNITLYGSMNYTFDYQRNYADEEGLYLDLCSDGEAPAEDATVIFCGVSAVDAVDGDLSALVEVTGTKNDEGLEACPIETATAGTCPPGTYLYSYRVTDSAGLTTTSEVRTVTIVKKAVVGGAIETASTATMVEEAEAEAVRLAQDDDYLTLLCDAMLQTAPPGTECAVTGVTAGQSARRRRSRGRSLRHARATGAGGRALLESGFSIDFDFELTLRSADTGGELDDEAAGLGSSIAASVGSGNLTENMAAFAREKGLDVEIPEVSPNVEVETEVQEVDFDLVKWSQGLMVAYNSYQTQLDNTKTARSASKATLEYRSASLNAPKFQRAVSDSYVDSLKRTTDTTSEHIKTADELIDMLDELQAVLVTLAAGPSDASAITAIVQESVRLQDELRSVRTAALAASFVGEDAEELFCSRHDASDLSIDFNVSSYELYDYDVVTVDYVYDPSTDSGADSLLERYLQLVGGATDAAAEGASDADDLVEALSGAVSDASSGVAASNATESRRRLLRAGGAGGAGRTVEDGGLARVNTADGKRFNITIAELRELEESGYINLGVGPEEPIFKRSAGRTNRLLAGMVVHQTRAASGVEVCGSRRFDHLGVTCRDGSVLSGETFGVDPVFLKGTQLYEPSLQSFKELFYDLSANSSETFGKAQTPFGFATHPLKGYRDGFWVLFDTSFTRTRFFEMVLYLDEGGFIDSSTRALTTAFYFYNAEASTFITYSVDFDFVPGGYILVNENVQALPVNLYSTTQNWVRAALEGIVALIIAYAAASRVIALLADIREAGSLTGGIMRRLLNGRALVDDVIVILLVMSLLVWWSYVFSYLLPLEVEPRYSVYDDLAAAARYLLHNREGTPRGESRWDKPLDAEDLILFEKMVSTLDTMSNLLTLYFTLCGIVLLILMVRLLMLVHFQPQFKRTTLTLIRSASDVAYVVGILMLVMSMFAATAVIVFGDKIIYFRTFQDSVMYFFTIILGEISVAYELTRLSNNGAVTSTEYWVGFIMVVVYAVLELFIVANFLLAELGDAFVEVRSEFDASTRPDDKVSVGGEAMGLLGEWYTKKRTKRKLLESSSDEAATMDAEMAVEDTGVEVPPFVYLGMLHKRLAQRKARLDKMKNSRTASKRAQAKADAIARGEIKADRGGCLGVADRAVGAVMGCVQAELSGLVDQMGLDSDDEEELAERRAFVDAHLRMPMSDGSSWVSRREIVACLCTLQAQQLRAIVSGSGDSSEDEGGGFTSHPLHSALDHGARESPLGSMSPRELAELIAEKVLDRVGVEVPEYEEEKRQEMKWLASKEMVVEAQIEALQNIVEAQHAVLQNVHQIESVRMAAALTIQAFARGWKARRMVRSMIVRAQAGGSAIEASGGAAASQPERPASAWSSSSKASDETEEESEIEESPEEVGAPQQTGATDVDEASSEVTERLSQGDEDATAPFQTPAGSDDSYQTAADKERWM